MAPISNPKLRARIRAWAKGNYLDASNRDQAFLGSIIVCMDWGKLSTEFLDTLVEAYIPHDQAWPFSVVRMLGWFRELQETQRIPPKPRRIRGPHLSMWRLDMTVFRWTLDLHREDTARRRLWEAKKRRDKELRPSALSEEEWRQVHEAIREMREEQRRRAAAVSESDRLRGRLHSRGPPPQQPAPPQLPALQSLPAQQQRPTPGPVTHTNVTPLKRDAEGSGKGSASSTRVIPLPPRLEGPLRPGENPMAHNTPPPATQAGYNTAPQAEEKEPDSPQSKDSQASTRDRGMQTEPDVWYTPLHWDDERRGDESNASAPPTTTPAQTGLRRRESKRVHDGRHRLGSEPDASQLQEMRDNAPPIPKVLSCYPLWDVKEEEENPEPQPQ